MYYQRKQTKTTTIIALFCCSLCFSPSSLTVPFVFRQTEGLRKIQLRVESVAQRECVWSICKTLGSIPPLHTKQNNLNNAMYQLIKHEGLPEAQGMHLQVIIMTYMSKQVWPLLTTFSASFPLSPFLPDASSLFLLQSLCASVHSS